MIKILYFSWVRERLGVSEQLIDTNATNIGELIDELKSKDEKYKLTFDDLSLIKIAANQKPVDVRHPLKEVTEVAFFPPMTGG